MNKPLGDGVYQLSIDDSPAAPSVIKSMIVTAAGAAAIPWSQKVGAGSPHHGSLANYGKNKSFATTKTFWYYGEMTT